MGAAVPCSPPRVPSHGTQQSCLRAGTLLRALGEAPSAYWEAWGLHSWHTGPSQLFLRWEDNSTDSRTPPPLASACSLISCVSYLSSSVTPHPKPWPLGALHPSPDLLAEPVRHMPTSGPSRCWSHTWTSSRLASTLSLHSDINFSVKRSRPSLSKIVPTP